MSSNIEPAGDENLTRARVCILEAELETVRWLTSKAADDKQKAAASLRVLELTKEIQALRGGEEEAA